MAVARAPVDLHEAVGSRIGQRPQQDGVDDAENRGIRADPDGERGESDRGETRPLDKGAKRVVKVPSQHAGLDGR